ncbi:MAG: aldo/keto reductase [Bryobacteraceae bacterium]|nr:aldo/keto reductase [Bryobacteraceae bacterium]
MSISRREFLETTALSGIAMTAAGAEVDKKTGMPMRVLGKTGARVSILAFGSGSRWLAYKEEDKALEAMNKALDLGVNYIDTAYGYGNGLSEERVGKLLKARGRKGLWIATQVDARPGDDAKRIIEGSLKRLQLDQVDLLHVHSLTGEEDLKAVEAKGNVLDVVRQMRDQKVCRFIGVTSHTNPTVLATALERHDFDCTQMALNAAQAAQVSARQAQSIKGHFETTALPIAKRKNMGVTAMKIFAQERLSGKAPVEQLIRYSMSLPVAAAVIGMPKLEHIEQNIQVAKSFKPMSKEEMQDLSGRLSQYQLALDRFFADHVDA